MQVILTRKSMVLEEDDTKSKLRLLDLDTLIISRITPSRLLELKENPGVDILNLEDKVVFEIDGLTNINIKTQEWKITWSKSLKMLYNGLLVDCFVNNGIIMLKIGDSKFKLLSSIDFCQLGKIYFDYIEKLEDVYFLHYKSIYLDSSFILFFVVAVSDGKPIGVFCPDEFVRAYVCDKKAVKLSAKMSMILGNDWWRNLRRLKE